MEDLMSVAQLAEKLGVSGELVRRLAKSGHIPSLRLGRRILFRPSDVEDWMNRAISGDIKFPALVLRCTCGEPHHLRVVDRNGDPTFTCAGGEVECASCGETLSLGSFAVGAVNLTLFQSRGADLGLEHEHGREDRSRP